MTISGVVAKIVALINFAHIFTSHDGTHEHI